MKRKKLPRFSVLVKEWNKSKDPASFSSYSLWEWVFKKYDVSRDEAIKIARKLLE